MKIFIKLYLNNFLYFFLIKVKINGLIILGLFNHNIEIKIKYLKKLNVKPKRKEKLEIDSNLNIKIWQNQNKTNKLKRENLKTIIYFWYELAKWNW